jgi:Flp pilus assembly protein TadD
MLFFKTVQMFSMLQGDYDSARKHYKEVLKLDPSNQLLRENVARLDRAQAQASQKPSGKGKT